MSRIEFGSLKIDPVQLGSQGNAILGIRDSGKSYTATYLAERLFEADIPFIAFDPIGIWRFLRVPGAQRGGKGYPVVVAGGKEGDLPLTEAAAPVYVRAAMRDGVSLVIDLFDINLSKSAWRRIVTQCVRALLHENQAHGLRHVFLEEAAEFIPQKPNDWDVYNELEKLARMGGNSRLGYTLINQRSQEVSKAILELCENIFLHRQRGKNALENLDKWLSVAGADERLAILKSLPDLPQGDCWAWIGGDKPRPPTLVHVPRKNSLHPDRRVMRGDIAAKPKNAVDVGKFVAGMKSTLVEVEELDKANNPVQLRKRIAELEAAAKKTPTAPPSIDKAAITAAEERGFEQAKKKLTLAMEREVQKRAVDLLSSLNERVGPLMHFLGEQIKTVKAHQAKLDIQFTSGLPGTPAKAATTPKPAKAAAPPARKPSPAASGDGNLTKPMAHLLQALAWWLAMGHAQPTRAQLAAIAGWKVGGSNMRGRLAELSTAGLVQYPSSGTIAMTEAGQAAAPAPDTSSSLVDSIRAMLTNPQLLLFNALLKYGDEAISREQAAGDVGWEAGGSNMRGRLAELSSLELINYPTKGQVVLQDWVVAS